MASVQTSLLLVQRTEVGNGPFAATLERGLANVPAEVHLREALKKSEDQAAKLSAESREAATVCAELSQQCDKQVKRNDELREQLRNSQAEAQELRSEMYQLRWEEERRLEALAAKEQAVENWEAGRLKELPKLKTELKQRLACQAEYHLQSLEEEARNRVAAAEKHFTEQVRNLQAELNKAKETNADLGRKCFASYQAAAHAHGTSRQSQAQSLQLHQELQWLRAERLRLQQELQRQQVVLGQEEQAAASFKAKLESAESASNRSAEVSQELQKWMLMSLSEVNRSAHPSGRLRSRHSDSVESNWVEMLEKFRKSHQVRNGHGCRTK